MDALRIDRLAAPAVALADEGGRVVLDRCHRAFTRRARLVGLLATPDLHPREGVWLEPCAAVHTVGLRVGIGVAFLDADGGVIRVADPLPPGRAARQAGARAAVEARAGVLASVTPGTRLLLVPPAPSALSASGRGAVPAPGGRCGSDGPPRGPVPTPEVTS